MSYQSLLEQEINKASFVYVSIKLAVQEDVQKEDFTANSSIGENACQEENILANEKVSSLVVLENVNKSTSHEFLTLLVENISGLSGEKDFQMELVIEKNAAIVTFKQNLGKKYKHD